MKRFQLNSRKHITYSLLLMAILLLNGHLLFAQKNGVRFKAHPGYPYLIGTDTSYLGFAGGLHAPSFGSVDMDLDGLKDLVVKDARSDRAFVFTSEKKGDEVIYTRAIHLENKLPSLLGVFIFADVNYDGKMDIITGNTVLDIFTNRSGTEVVFEKTQGPLRYDAAGVRELVRYQSGEQPTIADINGDGHMDILVFNNLGTRVLYYENQATAVGTFDLELKTDTWGFFEESGLNSDVTLGVSKKERHPGSKMLAFDAEGDGDLDLLISDITSATINFLENGKADLGLPYDSMIRSTSRFPEEDSINIPIFPSFHLVDYNLDGNIDLLCSNSSISPVINGLVWAYENTSSTGFDFRLETKSFLQEEMIDLGIDAIPTTMDIDADGDLDLLVSGINHLNEEINQSQFASITLFENVGTAQEPVYTLKEKDYLGLLSIETPYLCPTVGDLNNDGVLDLLIGNARGRLWYVENQAASNEAADFGERVLLEDIEEQVLDVGVNARPAMYDLNEDGYMDFVVGEQAGNINYYEGGEGFSFTLVTQKWGNVKTNITYADTIRNNDQEIIDTLYYVLTEGNSHPAFADIDGNGEVDLMVGSSWGRMYLYMNINTEDGYFWPEKGWLQDEASGRQVDKDLGESIAPHMVDFDADGYLELIVGSGLGGLEIFSTDSVKVGLPTTAQELKLTVFPNPSSGSISIQGVQAGAYIRVLNLNGQVVHQAKATDEGSLQLELPEGVFVVAHQIGNRISLQKVVILSN